MSKGRSQMDILIEESLALREELIQATKSLEEFAAQLMEDARRLREGEADDESDPGAE